MDDITKNMPALMIEKSTPRRASVMAIATLVTLSFLVVIGSGFLIFYTTILHSVELKAQATTVVNTILTNQARATEQTSPQSLYMQFTNKPPSFTDSLNAPMGIWFTGTQGSSSCTFTKGAYHIHIDSTQQSFFCRDTGTNYSDFVFQVQMTILNGASGGILFRGANQGSGGYSFDLTTNGLYNIDIISNNPPTSEVNKFGLCKFTHMGLNQSNTLTVIARGTHFLFYVNKQFVTNINDATLNTGTIGLFATNPGHHFGTDVAFNNAQLWML